MSNRIRHFAAAVAAALLSCDTPLQEQYVLASQSSLPEGVAYDAETQTFFATAVRGGELTRISPLGQEHVFYRHDDVGVSFLGAEVDGARRRLWVCEVDLRGSQPASRVVALDLEEARPVSGQELPPGAYCNDVAVAADGSVYVSDSAQPNIYKVDADGAKLELFATDPRFAPSIEGQLGLNGIAVAPDGESLLVVRMSSPALFRVGLGEPREVSAVGLTGDEFGVPDDPRFPGPDGVAFLGESLYVAFDGGVQEVAFVGEEHRRASVRTTTAVPRGLSSLTVTEDGQLYAIDSEAYRVLYEGRPAELPFRIVRVDLGSFDE